MEVMYQLSIRPYVNPREHLWDKMAVHIRDKDNPPITAVQLRVAVQQVLVALRPVKLMTLVRSMPCRASAVRTTHGGHTNH